MDLDNTPSDSDHNAEPTQPQITHRLNVEKQGSDSDSEFLCSICILLSVQPTTLICGHTFCRHCLAQWYFTSKKKECPLCKTQYQGHPKVNTQLRNLLTKMQPEEMKQRVEETKGEMKIIEDYDKEMTKEKTPAAAKSDLTSFCSGIIVALCIFVVAYLAWYWKSHDENLLVRKPVTIWNPADVETWLKEISWGEQYAHLAQENNIDGRLLLSVNEEDLIRLFNISEMSHAKALMLLVTDLHDKGVKMPADLWEYKALYPGRCLFLVYGLKDFPRTTILYMWMYYREEMFNPFVIATQEDQNRVMSHLHSINDTELLNGLQPSNRAFYGFLYYTVFMPEYLVGTFAYNMFRVHFFTPFFVLATLISRLILEVMKFKEFVRNRSWKSVNDMIKSHAKHLMSAFIFMVLWPIVPRFICDVFFYCALYLSPIQQLSSVYTKLRQQ